jgi:molybdate transport system substrate-binding protein
MKKIVFLFLTTLFLSAESLNLYCGVTMSEAMQEIADKFEAKTGVKVNIIKGGSGKLYKTILKKKSGDLYFPGSYKFIVDDENNLFGYQKLMGYNKAVILVQKGNPKHIKGLEDFTRQGIKVVLGDKNSGSVGKITKRILTRFKDEKFFKQVYDKAIKVPTSVEIMKNLKAKLADVSINWRAAAYKGDNKEFVDFINIPYIAPKQKLVLTVVKYSKNPELAKKFVKFAFKNKKIMKERGF